MGTPLLTTKFYIPPVRPEVVSRPRLIDQLDAGLRRSPSVILISAPAGFGKTILLSQWLDSVVGRQADEVGSSQNAGDEVTATPDSQLPTPRVAWLALDQDDNDPVRFFTYVIAALESASVDAGDAQALLQSPRPPPLKTALTPVINSLAALPDACLLVLDDYQLIEQPSIHEALTFFIDHMPPQLHLVIAGRADPPLPLARWRTRGELTELRAAELRFTPSETVTFLNQAMGLGLSPENMATLAARTEGWIAGLQLAALSLQGRTAAEVATFVAAFSGSHRHVIDYLAEEVLDQQPEALHDFLCQTSILEHLSAPLCAAVTGREDSEDVLRKLEQDNLFLIPLDERRQWYRYHHLFADCLRSRLHQRWPNREADLHRRASVGYEQQAATLGDEGLTAAAIHHALVARDFERAARLVEQATEPILLRSEVATFQKWVEAIPEEARLSRPLLSVYYAGLQLLAGESPEVVEAQLQQVLATHPSQAVSGAVAAFQALIACYQGDIQRSAKLGQRALELLPAEYLFLRSFIPGFLGLNYLYLGDVLAARQALSEAAATGRRAGNVMISVLALCHLAELSLLQARPQEAKAFYQQALDLAVSDTGRRRPIAGYALMGLGRLLFEWNDLEGAAQHLGEGIELIKRWADIGAIQGFISLAKLRQAQGDPAAASQAMQTAQQLAQKFEAMQVDDLMVGAYQADLWVIQGNFEAAWQWAQERRLDTPASRTAFEQAASRGRLPLIQALEYATLAEVYLARQQADKALAILQPLLTAAERAEWTVVVIEILVWQALAYQALGDTVQAMIALEQALSLAQPTGLVRGFVDQGRPLADLLRQAKARGIWPEYVQTLLAAFPDLPSGPADKSKMVNLESEILEPLSEREREVLSLVAAGLSNREIGEHLVVAVSTVKTHLNTIYRKLDVSSRTQAVARARELNLF